MLLHLWVVPLPLYIALLVLGGLMLGSSVAVIVYECLVMPARPVPTTITPTRPRCVFHRRNNAVLILLGNLVLVANLVFIGRFITDQDTIAATVALKVT